MPTAYYLVGLIKSVDEERQKSHCNMVQRQTTGRTCVHTMLVPHFMGGLGRKLKMHVV